MSQLIEPYWSESPLVEVFAPSLADDPAEGDAWNRRAQASAATRMRSSARSSLGERTWRASPSTSGPGAPGEVLASRTVKDLVAGSGLSFADRGTRDLKGVPDTWQIFAATE
jgi:hypothetical protein